LSGLACVLFCSAFLLFGRGHPLLPLPRLVGPWWGWFPPGSLWNHTTCITEMSECNNDFRIVLPWSFYGMRGRPVPARHEHPWILPENPTLEATRPTGPHLGSSEPDTTKATAGLAAAGAAADQGCHRNATQPQLQSNKKEKEKNKEGTCRWKMKDKIGVTK